MPAAGPAASPQATIDPAERRDGDRHEQEDEAALAEHADQRRPQRVRQGEMADDQEQGRQREAGDRVHLGS